MGRDSFSFSTHPSQAGFPKDIAPKIILEILRPELPKLDTSYVKKEQR